MKELNQWRMKARTHQSQEVLARIAGENQILLNKIIRAKDEERGKAEERQPLAVHEKRVREQERINQENKRIAMRVINQRATLKKSQSGWMPNRDRTKPTASQSFYQHTLNSRALPKLVPSKH